MKQTMPPKDLEEYRKSLHLSHAELAELVGVTPQAVKFWEAGERRVPETTTRLIRLFKKFPQLREEF